MGRSAALIGLITFVLTLPVATAARDRFSSLSGDVRIVGGAMDIKAVAVGDRVFPLEVSYAAELIDKIGNLILVAIYSGGTGCPAEFAWLNTTPGKVGLSETFGTCADVPEVSYDAETVTVTMNSFDASEGLVAFVYDGEQIERRSLGLVSSDIARTSKGDVNAWIGESPYEYLTAPEHEAEMIANVGWDVLDELRNTMIIGSQEMIVEGNWIVGSGCQPHMCNTDFAAMALHRGSGNFIAAIKRDGVVPRLIGKPPEALPVTIRKVMTSR
ncbi:hypothetical protein SAMN04488523_102104 [Sulfitobacter brevis]|uniref:Uncharacterized protein n=1 Tax=Sulfitobacter brevis TaxID=74348 RepID=A0A1I1ULG9_9RHOB|nr:hypothetical protein [Sulfitobacter brevis]SFD69593.1 hypothetical protein SAMN04488523_102104 [Sulfitobacter brevis]